MNEEINELIRASLPVQFKTVKYGTISVAKNANAYCTPRDNKGPYTEVEIGLWTNPPEYLKEYCDGSWERNEGELRVFAYVPISILGRLLIEE